MLAKEFTKPKITTKLLTRIFSSIKVSTEHFHNGIPCWEWQLAKVGGYGVISIKRRNSYAHRYIYQLFVETIPSNMQCDHLCRVRHCVNPAHIEITTPKTNTLRGEAIQAKNAKKTHCIHGHAFDKRNTYYRKNGGGRSCRRCYVEKYSSGVGHNRDKTHCVRGHLYSPENTYYPPHKGGKSRICRTCQRERGRINQTKYRRRDKGLPPA